MTWTTKPTYSLLKGFSWKGLNCTDKKTKDLNSSLIYSKALQDSDPKGPDFWSGTFPTPHDASASA